MSNFINQLVELPNVNYPVLTQQFLLWWFYRNVCSPYCTWFVTKCLYGTFLILLGLLNQFQPELKAPCKRTDTEICSAASVSISLSFLVYSAVGRGERCLFLPVSALQWLMGLLSAINWAFICLKSLESHSGSGASNEPLRRQMVSFFYFPLHSAV